jgi:endonuclease/exonuclease/phosphatase family metal-dependent hydrolase
MNAARTTRPLHLSFLSSWIQYLLSSLLLLGLASIASAEEAPLTVMTYNLRFASTQMPHAWHVRRPLMRELIKRQSPDVIGTQEGVYQQIQDLAADLPGYDWIGLGRDGGSRGEFMAVFYCTERLDPLEFDHFWLSDTPEAIGSITWGNTNRRMVTWVRFRDRQTDQEFYFFNTHFDHRLQDAREKSAELLLGRVNGLKTTLPILLVGDFNAAAGMNRVYEVLVGPHAFTDTWTAAETHGELIGTFHGYLGPIANGYRIDWILSRGTVQALDTEIITFAQDGQYASDHFPVVARVRLGADGRVSSQ